MSHEDEQSEAAWTRLQWRASHLPAELCQMIMKAMLADVFGPKEVRPEKENSIINVCLALNMQLYCKYSDIYWSQNTWIVGSGPANDAMRFMTEKRYSSSETMFSKQQPNRAALRIRCIKVAFSIDDIGTSPEAFRGNRCGNAHSRLALFEPVNGRPFQTQSEAFKSRAFRVWQDKFDRLAMLHLERLSLDFTDTVLPDGEYVGLRAVEHFVPFAYGMPKHFKIFAPSEEISDGIRTLFVNMNS